MANFGLLFAKYVLYKRDYCKKNTTKIGRITHCDALKKVSPTTGRQKMDAHPSSPGPWVILNKRVAKMSLLTLMTLAVIIVMEDNYPWPGR